MKPELCNPHLLAAMYVILKHEWVHHVEVYHLATFTETACVSPGAAHDDIRDTTCARVSLVDADGDHIGWIDVAGYEGEDWLLDHSIHRGMTQILAPILAD